MFPCEEWPVKITLVFCASYRVLLSDNMNGCYHYISLQWLQYMNGQLTVQEWMSFSVYFQRHLPTNGNRQTKLSLSILPHATNRQWLKSSLRWGCENMKDTHRLLKTSFQWESSSQYRNESKLNCKQSCVYLTLKGKLKYKGVVETIQEALGVQAYLLSVNGPAYSKWDNLPNI